VYRIKTPGFFYQRGHFTGMDPVLRIHCIRQNIGLVSDEGYQLIIAPANRSELRFEE